MKDQANLRPENQTQMSKISYKVEKGIIELAMLWSIIVRLHLFALLPRWLLHRMSQASVVCSGLEGVLAEVWDHDRNHSANHHQAVAGRILAGW